jgi:hypothetical protein
MNHVYGRELGLRRAFYVAKHTSAQIFSEISRQIEGGTGQSNYIRQLGDWAPTFNQTSCNGFELQLSVLLYKFI